MRIIVTEMENGEKEERKERNVVDRAIATLK